MSKSKAIITAIIAVVVIGGGIFYFTNKDKKTDTSSNSADTSQSTQTADNTVAKKFTDACQVFTKEEISAALGGTFGDGEAGIATSTGTPGSDDLDDLRGSSCDFEQDNDGTTAGMTDAISFSVEISNYKNAEEASTYMNGLRNPSTAEGQEAISGVTDVDGVGEQAFFPRVNTAEGVYEKTESLNVLVGRQVVILSVTRLDGIDRDAVRTALTTLGQKL